jgi:hypothetical protein
VGGLVMNSFGRLIFVIDKSGGDIAVYMSLADAERHLEAIDVQNNEYEAFDAEGRLLRLTTEQERVRIAPSENEPNHADELRQKLLAFLRAAKAPSVNSGSSLSQLVNAASQFVLKP